MRKNQNQTPKCPDWQYAIPFFLVLGAMTVASFIISLRPTVSNVEKRELAKFPEFSVEALASGTYFDDVTLWFSDTFPGREDWLDLATQTKSLHGHSDIIIQGSLPSVETVPPAESPDPPEQPLLPQEDPSAGPQETEQAQPQQTEPEGWGGLDAGDDGAIMKGSATVQIGDTIFWTQGFSADNSDHYTQTLNDFVQAVEGRGVTVVNMVPPTAVGILIEKEYMEKLNCVDQGETLAYIHSNIRDDVVKVDTVSALLDHNDEYIYFRTDHHWTALGAYYCYEAMCRELGMEPVDIDTLEVWDQGLFQGSMYGHSTRPAQLRADTVYAYVPKGDIHCQTFSQNGNASPHTILTDCSQREPNTKYLVFGTDYPMLHAENRSIPDAPNVAVIKDSFGNCMVPFLTQNFHNVYALDYRKFNRDYLANMIEAYDIDYVIFMPNLTATQSSDGPRMIRRTVLGYGK